jgi:hypothetical protein
VEPDGLIGSDRTQGTSRVRRMLVLARSTRVGVILG